MSIKDIIRFLANFILIKLAGQRFTSIFARFTNGALPNAPADVDETSTEARFEKRFRQERQAC
jgi:hypothetical protein